MIRPLALALALSALSSGSLFAEPLVVAIDHSARLSVSGAAASVILGNPQVADVTVVDSHTLFVSGRAYGETDVVVLDGAGRTLYSGDIRVAGGTGGQVSVYRGPDRTDMACAPSCEVTFRSPTKGSSNGSAGGTAPTGGSSNASGGLGQMLGGAVSAAGSSVGHAMGLPAPQ